MPSILTWCVIFETWNHSQLCKYGWPSRVLNCRYNLFERSKVESDYMPLYSSFGLGTTTWSPLAFGLLSGKYSNGVIPEGSRFSMDVSQCKASPFIACVPALSLG